MWKFALVHISSLTLKFNQDKQQHNPTTRVVSSLTHLRSVLNPLRTDIFQVTQDRSYFNLVTITIFGRKVGKMKVLISKSKQVYVHFILLLFIKCAAYEVRIIPTRPLFCGGLLTYT